MKVINKTRNVTLMSNGQVANTIWTRFVGLLGRKTLAPGDGLIIIPNNSVHCFFMQFPIDVIFADKAHKVVHISHNLKPWRLSKIVPKAHYVVELPAHTATQTGTQLGDLLEWQEN
ncbi:DUF192 domain-containing protein [Candidatus Chlorohelix sp.]|uniref:DUF192 domain-containing protein n=1 Tax=Candidatus Chlorohelix sp. TaxID=3139201 RepID=UPI003062C7B9